MSHPVEAQIEPLPELGRLQDMWRGLEVRSEASFFLSWRWIGAWLQECAVCPRLIVARRGGQIVGLGLVGTESRRFGPFRLKRLHLNQAGRADADCVCIEFNDILAGGDDAAEVRDACLKEFDNYRVAARGFAWREMRWAACPVEMADMPRNGNLVLECTKEAPSPVIDLAAVRVTANDYLALLSPNTRQQIRRSMRLYEAEGPLRAECAGNVEQGLAWLEELRALHQATWKARAKPGAFAQPHFTSFSERLVRDGLPEGEIDILRVSAGALALGYLCNFVHGGRVYNYLSGLRYDDDRRKKPGLVTHSLAVQHYAKSAPQVASYSFLAGESQYKNSLSTGSETLYWYSYRAASARIALDKLAATLASRYGR